MAPGRQTDEQEVPSPGTWLIQPNPWLPSTSPEVLAWVTPRYHPQPRGTFEEPVSLTGAVDRLPRAYIYCRKVGPGDTFGQVAARARSEAGWQYDEIDASHNVHIAAPHALLDILLRLAAD